MAILLVIIIFNLPVSIALITRFFSSFVQPVFGHLGEVFICFVHSGFPPI